MYGAANVDILAEVHMPFMLPGNGSINTLHYTHATIE
jgi:hypothetical protein